MLLLKSFTSDDRSIVPWLPNSYLLLSLRTRVSTTHILAYMLDSLVRVSRRVDWNHFANILSVGVMNRLGSLDASLVSMLSSQEVQEATGYPKNAADLSPAQGITRDYNTRTSSSYLSLAFYPEPN